MFPFLPLSQGFQPLNTYEWKQLVMNIEQHLLADPHLNNTHPECYFLMRQLFWMAFVAAFPSFPHGDWPNWNSQIPMEGNFISRWVLKDSDDSDWDDFPDTCVAIRQLVWEQFSTTVEKVLLIPITH